MTSCTELEYSKIAVQEKNNEDDSLDYEGSCEELSDDEEFSGDVEEDSEDCSEEEEEDPEPEDERSKCIWHVCKIWHHYKGRLQNDISRVAYLFSVQPKIREHSRNADNCDPEDREAVERIIEKTILPMFHERKEEREKELAELIHTFWEELDDFHNQEKFFNKPHIWHTAADEKTLSHVWHKHYSLPYTKVFGRVACYTTSQIGGLGEAERNLKAIKGNKTGKRSRLCPEKAKKQAVVSAAYSRKRSEARRANAQKAGELWNDDDFTWCKIDHYCTGSIVKRVREPIRIFRAYKEEWEKVQFDSKGDDIHAAKLSAKYGGLKYIDTEDPSKIGTFQDHFCVQLTKCRKNVTREQRMQGKGWFYTLVGVYEGFDKELSLESQEEFVDTWEREWDTYEMIVDYYDKFPDPKLKIYKEGECDDEVVNLE